ncbi:gamma-glutamylcyclotransferase (GGCT)/AIG2-like uncharacterized protein YtfP [Amorphus suaedae]
MRLTFAYGANLDPAGMRQRCPSAKPLGHASLENWHFRITIDGYASVAPRLGSTVHGVLWQISAKDEAALDAYEEVASGLYRKTHLPVRGTKGPVRALVYVGRSQTSGRPRRGYLDKIVLPAARAWGLPPTHLCELESWLRPG